jgi:Kef-type K+ transport system membrane component KefB
MPNLNLVANIGLILFLFLVGLEVDVRFLASNWRIALSVGIGGMALPFGLGCAIAWGLYTEFGSESGTVPIAFGVFMLFVGVAMAITVSAHVLGNWGQESWLTYSIGVPGSVSHLDRVEATQHSRRYHRAVGRSWE